MHSWSGSVRFVELEREGGKKFLSKSSKYWRAWLLLVNNTYPYPSDSIHVYSALGKIKKRLQIDNMRHIQCQGETSIASF